jgi:hypothetical protein
MTYLKRSNERYEMKGLLGISIYKKSHSTQERMGIVVARRKKAGSE